MTTPFWARLHDDLPRGLAGKAGRVASATWLEPADLLHPDWAYARSKILLGYGRDAAGRPIGIGTGDDRGLLTVAGSRGGKGRSLLIPNLLLYEGPAIVLDPKGELAAITARARAAMGQQVLIVDPFGVSGVHARADVKGCLARYNPLTALDLASPRFGDDVAVLADAMIPVPAKGETHWAESAQVLLSALIALALLLEPKADLRFVRRMLTGVERVASTWAERNAGPDGPIPREVELFAMMRSFGSRVGGLIAAAGAQMLEMGDKERGSVLSTARTQTRFLDSPELQAAMQDSTFDLADLKRGVAGPGATRRPATLYLCLPASMMGSHGRWLRVMINLALIAFERTPGRPTLPCLFVLEELCTTIGYSKHLEAAAGLMAGYGIRLWSVIQDLSQLKHHYSDSWETFVGNAGTLTFFANSDLTTLDYISRKLGQTGLLVETDSHATAGAILQGARSVAEQLRSEPLLTSSEAERILAREQGRILVLAAGKAPVILRRADYLEEPSPFTGKWDRHG